MSVRLTELSILLPGADFPVAFLNPVFEIDTIEYESVIKNADSALTITYTRETPISDVSVTIYCDGVVVTNPVTVAEGVNTIELVVTDISTSPASTQTYTIELRRLINNIDLTKYLPSYFKNTKWESFMGLNGMSFLLNYFKDSQVDTFFDSIKVETATEDDFINIIQTLGYPINVNYTYNLEYLKRFALTLVYKIIYKTTLTAYNMLFSSFRVKGDIFPFVEYAEGYLQYLTDYNVIPNGDILNYLRMQYLTCNSLDGWTIGGIGIDLVRQGSISIKQTVYHDDTSRVMFNYESPDGDTRDFTDFSGDTNWLEFWLYIPDITKFTFTTGAIDFGNVQGTQDLVWDIPTLVNGWNNIKVNLSVASREGTMDWTTGVNHFRIYFYNTNSGITGDLSYIMIKDIKLTKGLELTKHFGIRISPTYAYDNITSYTYPIPKHHYKLNETVGTSFRDDGSDPITGNHNLPASNLNKTGKPVGSKCFLFGLDGATILYADTNYDTKFNNRTICFWARIDGSDPIGHDTVNGEVIFGSKDYLGNSFFLGIRPGATPRYIGVGMGTVDWGDDFDILADIPTWDPEYWHLYIFTYNTSQAIGRLYVDNIAITNIATKSNNLSISNYFIGSLNNNGTAQLPFRGWIDDVRIYEYIIPSTMRVDIWNSGAGTEDDTAKSGNLYQYLVTNELNIIEYDTERIKELCEVPHLNVGIDTQGNETGVLQNYPVYDIDGVVIAGIYIQTISTIFWGRKIKLIDSCDTITGIWTQTGFDTFALDMVDYKQGTASIKATTTAITPLTSAVIQGVTSYGDYSAYSGSSTTIDFWFYVSDITKLSNPSTTLKMRFGTDTSNYYEWLVTGIVNGWNQVSLSIADATETGTVDWTDIGYLAVLMNYANASGSFITKIDYFRLSATKITLDSDPIRTLDETIVWRLDERDANYLDKIKSIKIGQGLGQVIDQYISDLFLPVYEEDIEDFEKTETFTGGANGKGQYIIRVDLDITRDINWVSELGLFDDLGHLVFYAAFPRLNKTEDYNYSFLITIDKS
jgi:hypothetical protein